MAFRYSPKIVTDGLVSYLDAANPKSFISGSTVWNDLSKNTINNGTLTNGPIYNSSNGGNIIFDGSDDFVTLGNDSSLQITNNLTLSVWFKTVSLSVAKTIAAKQWCNGNQFSYSLSILTNGNIQWYWIPSGNCSGNPTGSYTTNSSVITTNTWNNVIVVHTSTSVNIYVNGILAPSTLVGSYSSLFNSTSPLNIGIYRNLGGSYADAFNGNMASVQIYNRALSATEALQNYNTMKSRFGR